VRLRRFGRTDIDVSEVSFGAMRVTGDAAHVARSRPPTPSEVQEQNHRGRRALQAALDGGVNCFHSSDDYGTRWLLGEVLHSHPRRSDVHHVIKVTTPDYQENAVDLGMVRREVEQALSDLHAERISFVQHLQRGPRVSKEDAYSAVGDRRRIEALPAVSQDFLGVVDELRDEGKVGCAVTFPHTMAYAEAALQDERWAGMVHFFNLLETEGLRLLDAAGSAGRGYFALRPLLQGLITDKRVDRDSLRPGDEKLVPRVPGGTELFVPRPQ